MSPALRAELEASADYARTLDLLGYDLDWIEVAPEAGAVLAAR